MKNHGQQVMSVETPKMVVRQSTWQVADFKLGTTFSIRNHHEREGEE